MEKFRYKALDDAGQKVSGTEEAASCGAAHLALLDRGYQPLEVTEKKSVLQFEITKKKVPRKDVMHFSRQLGVFVQGGHPDHGGAGGHRRGDVRQAIRRRHSST